MPRTRSGKSTSYDEEEEYEASSAASTTTPAVVASEVTSDIGDQDAVVSSEDEATAPAPRAMSAPDALCELAAAQDWRLKGQRPHPPGPEPR